MGTFSSQRNLTPTHFGRLAAGSAVIHHPVHRVRNDYLTTIKNFVCNSNYSPAPAEPPVAQLLEHGLSELLSKLFPVGAFTLQTHFVEIPEKSEDSVSMHTLSCGRQCPAFLSFSQRKTKSSKRSISHSTYPTS